MSRIFLEVPFLVVYLIGYIIRSVAASGKKKNTIGGNRRLVPTQGERHSLRSQSQESTHPPSKLSLDRFHGSEDELLIITSFSHLSFLVLAVIL